MTKAQIIEKVSEQITTLTKRQAEVVVNTIFDCVRDSLKKGDKTEIRGFGSFRLRARRMKEGRNPKTGETVAVPAQRGPFFQAGKELKELLYQERSSSEKGTDGGTRFFTDEYNGEPLDRRCDQTNGAR